MALRRLSSLILLALLAVAGAAFAQEAKIVPLDRVLVVVNDEAITQWDLNEQRRIVMSQLKASNITPPPNDILDQVRSVVRIGNDVFFGFGSYTGGGSNNNAILKESGGSWSSVFAYDALGNIRSKNGRNYQYSLGPHQVTRAGSDAVAWDLNGNATTLPGNRTLRYDGEEIVPRPEVAREASAP